MVDLRAGWGVVGGVGVVEGVNGLGGLGGLVYGAATEIWAPELDCTLADLCGTIRHSL